MTDITAYEEDTLSIQVSFYDVDQTTAVTPSVLTWTLTDGSGNVINSRSNVSLTPSTTVWIELTGDDLALPTPYRERKLLISGSYDSILHGDGRKINREITFTIINAVNVSA